MQISTSTLKRLPKYLRILRKLKDNNILNVSSTMIATELNLNPIQVRKDLSLISKEEGKPKIGFEVDNLISDIEYFFDLNNSKDIIIVGAGRLGQALMNYPSFDNDINIVAAFDNDKKKVNNKNIFHIDKMKEIIEKNGIKIAIITVPKEEAQYVSECLVNYGIKVIWNFAPIELKVPFDIRVKNEDLSASLAILLNGIDFD